MENYQTRIHQHYEMVWESPGRILHWDKGPIEDLHDGFCILEFAPKMARKMWTYATCLMSNEWDDFPIEIHIFSPVPRTEIVELLTVVAHFHKNAERLSLGHTVNFGRPWLENSNCKHGLISLPYLDGPAIENLPFNGQSNEKGIKFYWLIPITENEKDYKIKYGLDALEDKFEEKKFNYLDVNRTGVV